CKQNVMLMFVFIVFMSVALSCHFLNLNFLSCYFFFFSSRRRHTRWPRDWSSDVCSSDLGVLCHGQTDLLSSMGLADRSRDFAIGTRLSRGNFASGFVHLAKKRGHIA